MYTCMVYQRSPALLTLTKDLDERNEHEYVVGERKWQAQREGTAKVAFPIDPPWTSPVFLLPLSHAPTRFLFLTPFRLSHHRPPSYTPLSSPHHSFIDKWWRSMKTSFHLINQWNADNIARSVTHKVEKANARECRILYTKLVNSDFN